MLKKQALVFVAAALAFGGCGDDGGTMTTDGGITGMDGSTGTDGGPGVDAGPACEDDTLGGTVEMPADFATVNAGNPTYTICPEGFDVFRLSATAGQVLKFSMNILGSDPAGANDLDFYLLGAADPETPLARGATSAAVEQISYNVEEDGVFILFVQSFTPEGGAPSAGDYTLSFETATACGMDAECEGDDICYVGVDDVSGAFLQECRAYTAPACGQGTAEDSGMSSHSDGTAVAFDTVATEGSFMGTLCGDDVDAFAFELAAGESFEGTLAATVPADSAIIAILVDPSGDRVGSVVLTDENADDEFGDFFAETGGAYVLYLDYTTQGDAATEVTYTMTATTLGTACRLDADCDGEQVCGLFDPRGPVAICVDEPADTCGEDTDNSQTNATELTSGTAVTDQVVCDTGSDWYKLTIEETSDIAVALTWESAENDLDVYVVSPEGLPYGAGSSFDTMAESYAAAHLAAGTYYFLVTQFTTDDSGTEGVSYSLTVTATASESGCTADTDCVAGGVTENDYESQLTCNMETGVCAPSSTEAIMSVAADGACFDGEGVFVAGQCMSGLACEESVCVDPDAPTTEE